MSFPNNTEYQCNKCGLYYTDVDYKWCKPCHINYLKNNFTNWTSGNKKIDDFIQRMQLKINSYNDIIEWIPYRRFVNIKKIGKDDYDNFTTIYSALWIDGLSYYDKDKKEWIRKSNENVTLESLDNSQNIINELLIKV